MRTPETGNTGSTDRLSMMTPETSRKKGGLSMFSSTPNIEISSEPQSRNTSFEEPAVLEPTRPVTAPVSTHPDDDALVGVGEDEARSRSAGATSAATDTAGGGVVGATESTVATDGAEGFFFNLDVSKSTEPVDESEGGGIRTQQPSLYGAMGVGAAELDEPLDPGVGYDTDDSDASVSVDVHDKGDAADDDDNDAAAAGGGGSGQRAQPRSAGSFYEGDKQRPSASTAEAAAESDGGELNGDATGYYEGLLRRVRERTAGMSKHDNAGFKREWQQIERVGTDAKHR